jgi:hypothetical protein
MLTTTENKQALFEATNTFQRTLINTRNFCRNCSGKKHPQESIEINHQKC